MSESRNTELLERMSLGFGNYRKTKYEPFSMIGYNPSVTTSEEEVWSNSSAYVFPVAAAQWRIAGGNAAELGTVIKGNAEGANQTVKCDATGSTTILNDADVDFSASTAVAVGDIVLLDPKGTNPEFGYVTDITDAATGKLVIGGGFSEGGSCATARAYTIVDKSSGTGTGGQVLEVYYLTSAFVEKKILICLNGATAVDFKGATGAALVDTYRLNGMRVVSVGTGGVPVAAIALQLQASPNTVYGNITAGYNFARAAIYTVPKDKVLFLKSITCGAVTANDTKVQAARMYLRATCEEYNDFRTPGIFYPFSEALISNGIASIHYDVPMAFGEGVDIKVSGIGLTGFSGPLDCVARGWLEDV
jgi:hypothetical protein